MRCGWWWVQTRIHLSPVLASTVLKRSTNQGISTLKAIYLYTLLLQIIHSHLQNHLDRTAACIGIYEPTVSADEVLESYSRHDVLWMEEPNGVWLPGTRRGLQTSFNIDRKGVSRSGAAKFLNIHGIICPCSWQGCATLPRASCYFKLTE